MRVQMELISKIMDLFRMDQNCNGTVIGIHSYSMVFPCEVCGKGFRGRRDHSEHMRVHTGRKAVCPICGEKFSNEANLDRHKREVNCGARPAEQSASYWRGRYEAKNREYNKLAKELAITKERIAVMSGNSWAAGFKTAGDVNALQKDTICLRCMRLMPKEDLAEHERVHQ